MTLMTPTTIEPYSPLEMLVGWNNQEKYILSYLDLRFYCPCAGCVDEHTGERTVVKSTLMPDVHPTHAQLVGRYAIQIHWSDGHNTGIYHFDRLSELCQKRGRIQGDIK